MSVAVALQTGLLSPDAHGDLPGGSVSLRWGVLRLARSRSAQGFVDELQARSHGGEAPRSVRSSRYSSWPGRLLGRAPSAGACAIPAHVRPPLVVEPRHG